MVIDCTAAPRVSSTPCTVRDRPPGTGDGTSPESRGAVRQKASGRRLPRWRLLVQGVIVAAGLVYVAWQLPGLVGAGRLAFGQVTDLRWGWLVAAVPLAVASLAMYGEMHRRLLAAGGARVRGRTVQAITFAQNAVSQTVPGVGEAASTAYAVSQLRRRGVDTALAAWAVVFAGLVAFMTLVLLGMAGLAWTGLISVPTAMLGALVAVALIIGGWFMLTHPVVLRRGLRALLVALRRLPGLHDAPWAADPDRIATGFAVRVSMLRLTPRQWTILLTLAIGTWAVDYLTLTASFAAVARPVPWAALALGYLLVQASIALQITPGGAGLADAGLFGVLVGSGVGTAPAAITVLSYRLIAWLGMALAGWATYAWQSRQAPGRGIVPATVTAIGPDSRDDQDRAA